MIKMQLLKRLPKRIVKKDVLCIILWGSIIREEIDERSDVDVLVITESRREKRVFRSNSISFEISYYPIQFVKEGIKGGDWWFIEALNYGIVLYEQNDVIDSLLAHTTEHRYFEDTAGTWIKIASSFYIDSLDLLDKKDFEGSVLNARYAAESAIIAFLLATRTEYPTPKRIFRLLAKNSNLKEMREDFSILHDAQGISKKEVNRKLKIALRIIDFCTKHIGGTR